MPTIKMNALVLIAQRTQKVDDAREAADVFRLPEEIRAALDERLSDVLSYDAEQQSTGAGRSRSVATRREAIKKAAELLKDGFRFLQGIPRYELSDADRDAALGAYGWQGGQMGELKTDTRVLALARQAIAATPTLQPEKARYPAPLITRLKAELDVVAASEGNVGVGGRQQATRSRNEALELLQKITARIRFFYCAMSDDTDTTAELAKLGLQPRRHSGQRRLKSEATEDNLSPASSLGDPSPEGKG